MGRDVIVLSACFFHKSHVVVMAMSRRNVALQHSRRYYNRRAAYYDLVAQRSAVDRETKEHLDFIESVIKKHADRPVKRVLDIACGGGRHLVGLARRGYECTGYDLAKERVEAAKARAKREGVSITLTRGDAAKLPKSRRYDAVLALFILFLLPSDDYVKNCLLRVRENLAPGGIFVCNIYNPFTRGSHWVKDLVETGTHIDRIKAPGIRITEVERLSDLDPVSGELWFDEVAVVEAPDRKHVFHDKGRVRLLTSSEVKHSLQDAGFSEVFAFYDWKLRSKKPKAEQIVFVAK